MAVDDTWYLTRRGPDGKRVESVKHGRGKRWRVRYQDDTGAPKERLFERQAEAEDFDAEVRTDVNRGQYIDPAAGKKTVAEYGRTWRSSQIHRLSTADRVDTAFRNHIDPVRLGGMRLAEVRRSHVQAWVKDRKEVLAPSTLHVVYGMVASMFATAVLDRAIATSPCQGVKLPEVDRADRVIPTPGQVHALAAALPEHRRAQVYCGAGAGLRQGETWGLELEHVNFMRREISIVQQLVGLRGRRPFLGPPKTKQSRRTVEMGTVLGESLARHIELFPPKLVEVEDRTDPDSRKWMTRQARLIFVNTDHEPWRSSAWARPWARAVASVGIAEGYGYHGLRHYYATLLIHGGASVKTVQLSLGHSKPSITLDMYTHDWPDALDRTRNLVDAALKDQRAQIGPNSVRLA